MCPSSPPPSSELVAPCDYAVCIDFVNGATYAKDKNIAAGLIRDRGRINTINATEPGKWYSMLGTRIELHDDMRVSMKEVTDGTSQTMMFFEDAGRPDRYMGTELVGSGDAAGTGWGNVDSFFGVHWDRGGQFMNVRNDDEIYSFHQGGCNFVMGDGSVHFIAESINPDTFVSLFTRNADDIVDVDF